MAAPSVVFGAIARATNWNETEYGKVPRAPMPGETKEDDTRQVLGSPVDCVLAFLPRN